MTEPHSTHSQFQILHLPNNDENYHAIILLPLAHTTLILKPSSQFAQHDNSSNIHYTTIVNVNIPL